MKFINLLFFFFILQACKEKNAEMDSYNVRSDIRLGTKFYSIYMKDDGLSYVIKGVGTYYTDTLKMISSETSTFFKLDSAKVFLQNLNAIKNNPINGIYRDDAPRVEVYLNHQKIYDAYKWDETFWNLFRPIMEQIPMGFNPFRANDNPFVD